MVKTLKDNYSNTATIEEFSRKAYADAPKVSTCYKLSLAAADGFIYHVSVYPTLADAMLKLTEFSCGTFHEEKKPLVFSDMVKEALETLKTDNSIFTSCIEALHDYNGFSDDNYLTAMEWACDEFRNMGAAEFITRMCDFNPEDKYFYYDDNYICSTNDYVTFYRERVAVEDLYDELLKAYKEGFSVLLETDYIFDKLMKDIIEAQQNA